MTFNSSNPSIRSTRLHSRNLFSASRFRTVIILSLSLYGSLKCYLLFQLLLLLGLIVVIPFLTHPVSRLWILEQRRSDLVCGLRMDIWLIQQFDEDLRQGLDIRQVAQREFRLKLGQVKIQTLRRVTDVQHDPIKLSLRPLEQRRRVNRPGMRRDKPVTEHHSASGIARAQFPVPVRHAADLKVRFSQVVHPRLRPGLVQLGLHAVHLGFHALRNGLDLDRLTTKRQLFVRPLFDVTVLKNVK